MSIRGDEGARTIFGSRQLRANDGAARLHKCRAILERTRQTVSQRHDLIKNAARFRTTTRDNRLAVRLGEGKEHGKIKRGIKEAADVLTDNDRLKRKGKLDQVVGKVKETATLPRLISVISTA